MTNKIYVGNLPFSYGFKELKAIFEKIGKIKEALVIADKQSGRSKGFGFVVFEKEESAQKAIKEMNEKEIDGRILKVKEASLKTESEKKE